MVLVQSLLYACITFWTLILCHLHSYVAVPGRNQTLFHYTFWLCYPIPCAMVHSLVPCGLRKWLCSAELLLGVGLMLAEEQKHKWVLFLKSPLWYVQLHCLLSPNRPTSFFSFPPPPSLEPAAVTSFPPHLLPQPYSGNMEPAFRVGCQHCYAHHSSYLLTQGVGGEEEVMAISSELCYLWVWGWIIPVIWIRDRHSGS